MDNITLVRSSEANGADIDQLIRICFGDRTMYGVLNQLDGRYILAYHGDKLVAMTGICPDGFSVLNGKEIDWTCCHPDYRRQGIVTKILQEAIQNVSKPIYCSAWHLSDNDKANLHTILNGLGFQLILPAYKKYQAPDMLCCLDCVNKKDDNCICKEDLYVLFTHCSEQYIH